MRIHILENKETVVNVVSQNITRAVKENPSVILGLATGSTPLNIYNYLVHDHHVNKTDYSSVTTFNLDEYIGLSKSDPQSYHYYMDQALFNHVNFNRDRTFIPYLIDHSFNESVQLYEDLLQKYPIDIQILGIGSNGHIGFNEPGTSFESITHVVTLSDSTRIDNSRFFNCIDDVPKEAITMGIKSILKAKKIILIALGKNKANIIKKLLDTDPSILLPATSLKLHNNVHLYLDTESASLIKDNIYE